MDDHDRADPDLPPQGEPVIRTIAMPSDTNPEGDIFGGWLVSQMDLAGATVAFRLAKGRCATVAVDGMTFLRPVSVGDEVSLYGRAIKVGRTSVQVMVEAWRRRRDGEASNRVTVGAFTYVAIGQDRRPRPISPAVGG
ncbi:MAG TPA: acyl-CoA thioesterase [Caulobacteraceae bacterium]|jgi:acyl-CoA thioesterase YciA|nr:acyl-CoA thioesterase [Caulobacteraceae bacterium]